MVLPYYRGLLEKLKDDGKTAKSNRIYYPTRAIGNKLQIGKDLAAPIKSQFAIYCAPWVAANKSTLVKQKGPSTHAKKTQLYKTLSSWQKLAS